MMRILLWALMAFLASVARAAPPPIIFAPTDHTAQITVSAGTAARSSNLGGQWNTARSDRAQTKGVRTVEFLVNQIPMGFRLV